MDDEKNKLWTISILIFGIIMGMLGGYEFGKRTERSRAIEAGVAAYHVVDDKGRVEFRYER